MQTDKGEQNFWQEGSQPQTPQTPSQPPVGPAAVPPSLPPQPVASPEPQLAPEAPAPAPFEAPEFDQQPALAPASPTAISWEASEFIYHQKSSMWYIVLGLIAVGLVVIAVLLLKDWFITIGLAFMIVAVGVVANRRPRTLQYSLDDTALHVGERTFPYREFQSFSLTQEGEMWSVILLPSGRFKPSVTIYFDEAQGEQIVDVLGSYLPMEEHKPDLVDKISSKIRF